jgi:hypothetical protein
MAACSRRSRSARREVSSRAVVMKRGSHAISTSPQTHAAATGGENADGDPTRRPIPLATYESTRSAARAPFLKPSLRGKRVRGEPRQASPKGNRVHPFARSRHSRSVHCASPEDAAGRTPPSRSQSRPLVSRSRLGRSPRTGPVRPPPSSLPEPRSTLGNARPTAATPASAVAFLGLRQAQPERWSPSPRTGPVRPAPLFVAQAPLHPRKRSPPCCGAGISSPHCCDPGISGRPLSGFDKLTPNGGGCAPATALLPPRKPISPWTLPAHRTGPALAPR